MNIFGQTRLCGLAAVLLFSVACKKDAPPAATVTKVEPPAPVKPKPPKAPVAGAKKSDDQCVGRLTDKPQETIKVGNLEMERNGSTVTLKGTDPDDQFVIGQLSDIKDHTPKNIASIKLFVEWFKKEGADAIVLNGDLGNTQKGIEHILDTIAGNIEVPVLAFIGNRECKGDFNKALAASHKKYPHVINMNHVRVFNADDASIVSLPAYYNATYLHCPEGCQYFTEDVAALETFAAETTAPVRVITAHGPPRMNTPEGLDRIHDGVNVGDQDLANFLAVKKLFPFGLFGNIQEAGGHATTLAGKKLPEGAFHDSLYLNPGPADHVPWSMLDGTSSFGMAGLLSIKGKQGAYKVLRLKEGQAKVE
jgi:predicted phosphodiesterase